MKTKKIPTEAEILKKARFSKGTVYDYQLCYDLPDGRTISVVKSSELQTRKWVEEELVRAVQEWYELH